jgi:hypothetical protein
VEIRAFSFFKCSKKSGRIGGDRGGQPAEKIHGRNLRTTPKIQPLIFDYFKIKV